jgi:hypothetical protein
MAARSRNGLVHKASIGYAQRVGPSTNGYLSRRVWAAAVIRASGGVEFPAALRQIPSVKACGDGCRVHHTVAD